MRYYLAPNFTASFYRFSRDHCRRSPVRFNFPNSRRGLEALRVYSRSLPSSSSTSPPGYSVAIEAIRQRPLHFHPAAGFNVFDSGTLYPTLQLISEPDTGHALPALPYHRHTHALSTKSFHDRRSPPHPYSHRDLVPSCLALSCSLALSAIPSLPEGHVLLVLAVAEPALRLFQTHFNSLPGSAVAEWRRQVRRT